MGTKKGGLIMGVRVCVEGGREYVGHKNKKAIHLVLVPFFPGGERIEKNEAARAEFPYVHIFFPCEQHSDSHTLAV